MKRALQAALGLGLSALFVWLSLRGAPLAEVHRAIVGADLRFVAANLACLALIHVVRVWRWGLLLKPVAEVRFRDVNALGAVGFLALMVLPLRLGEFARPMLVADRLKVRRTAALASVVVERVVDGLFMGLVLVVLLWGLGGRLSGTDLERVRLGSVLVTLAFGAGLAVLVLAVRHRARAEALVRRVVGRLSPGLAEKLAAMLGSFTDGLMVVPSARALATFLAVTCGYWALNATALCLLAPAFGFTLSPLEGLTVLGLQVIGAMVPAGPGMVGTMQFFTALGVALFIGDRAELKVAAVAFAHVGWALSFAQQVLTGLFFVVTGRVQVGPILASLARPPDAPAAAPAPRA
jgi:uncharacterized protein (TIRG00374 family)